MSGPARAGLFIYAKEMDVIASFYQAVAGLQRVHESAELTILDSPDIQLLVHRIPAPIADSISITRPPVRRETTALKFFFTVASLEEARARASALGGEVGHDNWQGPGFIVCQAMDPEGNIFQLREPTA